MLSFVVKKDDIYLQKQPKDSVMPVLRETSKIKPSAQTKVEKDELKKPQQTQTMPKEINGTKGPEPTRYGDWEHKGRCYDF